MYLTAQEPKNSIKLSTTISTIKITSLANNNGDNSVAINFFQSQCVWQFLKKCYIVIMQQINLENLYSII